MSSPYNSENRALRISAQVAIINLTIALIVALTPAVQAQTFNVIYNFTGGADGANPYAGLTMDQFGSVYGTTGSGGYTGGDCGSGCGTVFKLSHSGSSWTLNPLYAFQGNATSDGAEPIAGVTFGPDGNLYGTTAAGGGEYYPFGTVFMLRPPVNTCKSAMCSWNETVLYRFQGGQMDGIEPGFGAVVFDRAGNLYGTTIGGGCRDCETSGTVYEMSPAFGGWVESVIYDFDLGSDGGYSPYSGVVLDDAGSLFGTAAYDFGTVYELEPQGNGWRETTLHNFFGEGQYFPTGGLTLDSSGNLYGTTSSNGTTGGGIVFQLTPSGGNWTYSVQFNLIYLGNDYQPGPAASLVVDAAGNLYGTTVKEGFYGRGSVFKLTPTARGWTYTALHHFTGGSDGANPYSNIIFDAAGKLYGTASVGGADGRGVVFEITP